MSSLETSPQTSRTADIRRLFARHGDTIIGAIVAVAVIIAFAIWIAPDIPPWMTFRRYVITGLALGGVYALSGSGIVVLYRTTGVLNFSTGAVGTLGAFISYQLISFSGWKEGPAFLVSIAVATAITLAYGLVFGPALAQREPLVKATATLGLTLIVFGSTSWKWPGGETAYALNLPTDNTRFELGGVLVSVTQCLALGLGVAVVVITTLFLRYTKMGTAMRGLANDREVTAVLGVPVRRVEAVAWLWSGLLSGVSGLMLATLVGLDAATLTFFVLISSLAAALIARLRSLVGTLVAALVIGVVTAGAAPIYSISSYRDMAPFMLAMIGIMVVSRKGGALAGKRIV